MEVVKVIKTSHNNWLMENTVMGFIITENDY